MKYLVLYLTFLIGFIITGCSHTKLITTEHLHANKAEVNYSVIYYIHADSDYLFHTPDGKSIKENSAVLSTALKVGEAARSGEVFIYHQRPENKLLGLFPRRNSRLYHYKNGQLINQLKYRHPDTDEAFLTTEVQLMHQYRAQNQTADHQNYFLYFGHEIPSDNATDYHRSLPHIDVNTNAFAIGIQNFLLSDEDRFDLVVLSTCNNGTPAMAKLLMPFTDIMLASSQNLHLSHIDSHKMSALEKEPGISPLQLGYSLAEQTYQRLDTTVHTAITLGLYDLKDIGDYIHSLTSITTANNFTDQPMLFQDNVDCAEVNEFESGAFSQGVETWYKPARFGRKSGQRTHSGWGCKPVVE